MIVLELGIRVIDGGRKRNSSFISVPHPRVDDEVPRRLKNSVFWTETRTCLIPSFGVEGPLDEGIAPEIPSTACSKFRTELAGCQASRVSDKTSNKRASRFGCVSMAKGGYCRQLATFLDSVQFQIGPQYEALSRSGSPDSSNLLSISAGCRRTATMARPAVDGSQ